MKTSTFVRMERAGRKYGSGQASVTALQDVSCEVRPGDRIAVVGPSGSGKSTLLHLMGGLDTPTWGWVTWPLLGGRDELMPERVQYVFQTASLVDALTAAENVALPLLLAGCDAGDASERASEVLAALSLESIADKLPEELSGGQAQRVAVARALAVKPSLILADEPTGQLDHPTASRLLDSLLCALGTSDAALVVATHDPLVAERLGTVWTIQHGHMESA